jgi:hypothetical protein
MKEKIETLIEKQRHLLDVEIPDDEKIWNGISSGLGRRRTHRIILLSTAALFLLLIASAAAVSVILRQHHASENSVSGMNVSRQFGDEEGCFRLAVNRKLEEVKKSGGKGNEFVEMNEQLRQIDLQYETYLSDLRELGNQPKILNGMIRCYELKIRIIEKTLHEIKKNQHYENQTHIL